MKALLIHNGVAGGAKRKQAELEQAVAYLRTSGWEVELKPTAHGGHAIQLAAEGASQGCDAVIAGGGDGTVNEVVQGLAYSETALGVLPIGTVNVWSREAGFSGNIMKAAHQLIHSHRVTLDLGKVDGRYFLLMAGIGIDAEVTATLGESRRRKQQLRVLPYVLRTVQVLPCYRGAEIELELDGGTERHDALMVLASNTRLYAGIGKPNPNAVANDGMLDIRIFRGSNPVHTVGHIARVLLQRSPGQNETVRAERIVVRASPPLAVQVDGDAIGTTPVEISIQKKALQALVPSNYDRSLIDPAHA